MVIINRKIQRSEDRDLVCMIRQSGECRGVHISRACIGGLLLPGHKHRSKSSLIWLFASMSRGCLPPPKATPHPHTLKCTISVVLTPELALLPSVHLKRANRRRIEPFRLSNRHLVCNLTHESLYNLLPEP